MIKVSNADADRIIKAIEQLAQDSAGDTLKERNVKRLARIACRRMKNKRGGMVATKGNEAGVSK